ncbi:MAG: amidase [Acetobacteraceae bacterium]|nr:amidase [Acetobacteraceae bacterium]
MDPTFLSAKRQAALIRRGAIGCRELLDHYIARVERLDGRINAVVVRDFERARKRAAALDRAKATGGKLHGVPMTIKESFDIAGLPTTWGMPALKDHRAKADSVTVARYKAAGAVFFGKTNVPLNLADWQSFNAVYGTTGNPWDPARTPGGSSGGAAAALAAGLTGMEAGSDIGASIRNPAHYCGVFGHKPSWGICPQTGHAVFDNLDQLDMAVVGPMARSAGDLAIGLEVMAGPEDSEAAWQLRLPKPRATAWAGLRVAVMTAHPCSDVDTEMQEELERLAKVLRREGAKVSLTARPEFDLGAGHGLYIEMLRATTAVGMDDAAAAQWQAVRDGQKPDDPSYYAQMARGITMSHRHFLQKNETRVRMRRAWAAFFRDWDVLLCPPAASPAFPIDQAGERHQRSIEVNGKRVPVIDQMFWAGLASFYQLPATVAPLGLSSTGLPFGVQVLGGLYDDRTTIAVAGLLEKSWRGFVAPPGWE